MSCTVVNVLFVTMPGAWKLGLRLIKKILIDQFLEDWKLHDSTIGCCRLSQTEAKVMMMIMRHTKLTKCRLLN